MVVWSEPQQFDVMILSPKAGGVGLTITAANHVIHLSRWWNPAVEDQATDRVYRIGQTRDVHVHLPLAIHPDPAIRESSFDLKLNALMDRKRQLTRDLFLPPDASDGDLVDLFREVSLSDEEVSASTQAFPHSSDNQDLTPDLDRTQDVAADRPVLALPKDRIVSGIRRWKTPVGKSRPTEEIIDLFRGRDIEQVTIKDPYALASPDARKAQASFLAELAARCRRLSGVTIEYSPDIDGDTDDSSQRRQFGDLYGTAFNGTPPRLVLTRRNRRSRDDDFHDRFVEVAVSHAGGSVQIHELTIGRGLAALYDMRKECNVVYAPPGS